MALRKMRTNDSGGQCPICGGNENSKLFHRDFSSIKSVVPFEYYDVLKCAKCGMVYAGNIIETMPLLDYYAKLSKYENETYYTISQVDITENRKILDFIKPYLATDTRIIEYGCAMGNLLYLLKSEGYSSVTGIDPSERNINHVKSQDIEAYCSGLGEDILAINGKKYKFAIVELVLEHIVPVKYAVAQIVEHLESDGYIFIGVPDISRFSEANDLYQQFSGEHINYFSLQSLANLLGSYGLICVKYESDNRGYCRSIWKKTSGNKSINYVNDGDSSLEKYLQEAGTLAKNIMDKLSGYIGRTVYLWGAGTHTAMLFQLGALEGINIEAIIDSNVNYCGKKLNGIKVISPGDLNGLAERPVIISSQWAQESIKKQILRFYTGDVITLY